MTRYLVGFLAAGMLACGAAACGTEGPATSSSGPSTGTPARRARVSIKNYAFAPAVVRVKAGSRITFRNFDTTEHTATADDNQAFDSGTIKGRGSTQTVRFPRPGRFAYHCAFHAYMHGTVVVTP